MDIISHGLWSVVILNKKINPVWLFLSGALPDLVSSGIGFLYLLILKGTIWSTTTWPLLPIWIQNLYYFSHSILGALTFFIILFIFRWPRILIWPFLFHILLDIFTHAGHPVNRLIFPWEINTSFYIKTNWWENYWLIIINWLLLIFCLSWQYRKFNCLTRKDKGIDSF